VLHSLFIAKKSSYKTSPASASVSIYEHQFILYSKLNDTHQKLPRSICMKMRKPL